MGARLIERRHDGFVAIDQLDELKAELGIPDGETGNDALLTRLGNEYQSLAESASGRFAVQRRCYERWALDYHGIQMIAPFIIYADAGAIEEFEWAEADKGRGGDSAKAVAADDYERLGDNIVLRADRWPWETEAQSHPIIVDIEYDAGLVADADSTGNATLHIMRAAIASAVRMRIDGDVQGALKVCHDMAQSIARTPRPLQIP